MSFTRNILLIALMIAKSKADEPTAPNPFANLDAKEAPLYICKESGDPIKWKLPSSLDCSPVDTTLPKSIVNITLWFEDASPSTPIPIYECYSETTYTRPTFNSNFEIVETSWNKTSDISLETCRKFLGNLEGNDLHLLKPNLYGTRNSPNPTENYMASTSSSARNYYISVSQAFIDNEEWTVSTNPNGKKTSCCCFYKLGKWKSTRGIVLWDNDSKVCHMKKGVSTTCLVTGSRMSCREEGLSLNLINPTRRCGMEIGSTEEGIMFTQDNVYGENGLNMGTTPTSIFSKECTANNLEANNSAYDSGRFFKLTYSLLNDNSSFHIQFAHGSACRANSLWYDATRLYAEYGASVSNHFKMLGGNKDDKHLTLLDGQMLSIYKCSTIYEYQMLPRDSECIREWPITYIHEDVKKTGYVSGRNHEIVDLPTETKCDFSKFYFESGKHLHLLNDNSVVTNIPVLPFPGKQKN